MALLHAMSTQHFRWRARKVTVCPRPDYERRYAARDAAARKVTVCPRPDYERRYAAKNATARKVTVCPRPDYERRYAARNAAARKVTVCPRADYERRYAARNAADVVPSADIRAYMPPTPPHTPTISMVKSVHDMLSIHVEHIGAVMAPTPPCDMPEHLWPKIGSSNLKPSTSSQCPPMFADRAFIAYVNGYNDDKIPCTPTVSPASRLRYSLREGRPICIGAGSFGEVYVVSLSGVETAVCMKVFTARSRETDRNILVEAAKLMALNGCDSTPWCYGVVGLTDCPGYKRLGIVMEFIGDPLTLRSVTLQDLLLTLEKRPGSLPEPDWTGFAKTLALKLQRVHQRGIVINDIKSDNVMLRWCENTWDPVLIDVGQACCRDRCVHYGILPSEVEQTLQAYPQLAPELLEKDFCCEQSDVYSLGRIFCRIGQLCGSQNLWMLGGMCRVHRLEDRLDLDKVLYFLGRAQTVLGV